MQSSIWEHRCIKTMARLSDVYYAFWDDFVKEWCLYIASGNSLSNNPWNNTINTLSNLTKWHYPNFNNHISPKTPFDPTIQYIPEPWGGNDGTHPLQSVVINYNPGKGLPKQVGVSAPNFTTYHNAEINKGPKEKNYNYKNRAKPIYDVLKILGVDLNGCDKLENHLSVELIPWHSKGFTKEVLIYAQQNLNAIIEHSIKFAVEASKNICNDKLNRVVLFRISLSRLIEIFDKTKNPYNTECEIVTCSKRNFNFLENANFAEFKILRNGCDLFPDVRLISIWQPHRTSMNNFPYSADMLKIFGNI